MRKIFLLNLYLIDNTCDDMGILDFKEVIIVFRYYLADRLIFLVDGNWFAENSFQQQSFFMRVEIKDQHFENIGNAFCSYLLSLILNT